MTNPPLVQCVGKLVELSFENGEVVHARLLAIDPDDHDDMTYEVTRIIAAGSHPSPGTTPGATVIAGLHELAAFRLL